MQTEPSRDRPSGEKTASAACRPDYRPSIDGLRAVAILLVVGFHVFPSALRSGFLGVDIFFVISGYLISTILYREFNDPRLSATSILAGFYARRIRRILPALSLVLLTCYVLSYRYVLPEQFKDDGLNIAASAAFCENFAAARQTGYFEAGVLAKPLVHIWSLGVEEQFYFLWPLVVGLAAYFRIRLLPVIIFLGGVSYLLNFYPVGPTGSAAFYLPQTRLWELLVGAIAAIAAPALLRQSDTIQFSAPPSPGAGILCRHPLLLEILGVLGGGLVVAGFVQLNPNQDHLNAWTMLPVAGTALVICAGEDAWINRVVLSRPSLVWIGLISYPLYLWHWPLLTFARTTLENGDTLPVKLGAVGLAVLLAWATYRFLELPIRHGRFRRAKTMASLAATVAVGTIGLLAFRHDGYPDRFPPIIHELFDYAKNPYRGSRPIYLLTPDGNPSDFPVVPGEIDPAKPTILLWGDSYADNINVGLQRRFAKEYNIVERAMMSTAPIVGLDFAGRPNARPFNDFILETARQIRPDCVVLAANWCNYDWTRVEHTISALRSARITRIVVVGPVPEWEAGLPTQLLNYYRKHAGQPLPARMRLGAKTAPGEVDALMGLFCARLSVEYFSPYQVLSNEDGFIVRVGDDISSLVTYDSGHFTPAASEYVIRRFPELRK